MYSALEKYFIVLIILARQSANLKTALLIKFRLTAGCGMMAGDVWVFLPAVSPFCNLVSFSFRFIPILLANLAAVEGFFSGLSCPTFSSLLFLLV